MTTEQVVHEELIELDRDKVLALAASSFTPSFADEAGVRDDLVGEIRVEVMLEGEWVPVKRLLTLGEFKQTVALRMVATKRVKQ